MKLELNKLYSLFTTSEYILNKKVKICGIISYDRATKFKSFIENIAINEKFIDLKENINDYLKKQVYYDCCVLELKNGEYAYSGDHLIVWDDIIDDERTQMLNEDFIYKLTFKFKNLDDSDVFTQESFIASLYTYINSTFNGLKNKIEFKFEKIRGDELQSADAKLKRAEMLLDKTSDAMNELINLQKGASEINAMFSDNNILPKIIEIKDNVKEILDNTEQIKQNTN